MRTYTSTVVDTALWTRENLAWLAGLLEGEGSFMVIKRSDPRGGMFITISMSTTDKDVCERAQAISGCGRVYGPRMNHLSTKPCWEFRVARRDHVYALTVALWEWMGQRRRDQMMSVLKWFRSAVIAEPVALVKVCTGCNKEQPVTAFAVDKRIRSGYTARCRECAERRSHAWRLANPDKQREMMRRQIRRRTLQRQQARGVA